MILADVLDILAMSDRSPDPTATLVGLALGILFLVTVRDTRR